MEEEAKKIGLKKEDALNRGKLERWSVNNCGRNETNQARPSLLRYKN